MQILATVEESNLDFFLIKTWYQPVRSTLDLKKRECNRIGYNMMAKYYMVGSGRSSASGTKKGKRNILV